MQFEIGVILHVQEFSKIQKTFKGAFNMSTISTSKGIVSIAVFIAMAGCSTSSQHSSGVVAADQAMVAGCTFLGDVVGSSGFSGLAASTGMANARSEALGEAANMGATHIVWGAIQAGWGSTANGKAYRCQK